MKTLTRFSIARANLTALAMLTTLGAACAHTPAPARVPVPAPAPAAASQEPTEPSEPSEPSEQPDAHVEERERLNAFSCAVPRSASSEGTPEDLEARAAALKLDLAVDYVRFVRYSSETEHETFAATGEPCRTARNQPACKAQLAKLDARGRAKRQVFAITTLGDDLQFYEGRAVLPLLGPIDNADKAWLVLMIEHDASSYTCDDPDWNAFRATPDGFELAWVTTTTNCRPWQRVQAIDHVDRAGKLTRLRQHIVEHDPDRCLVDERAIRRVMR
jgi:hypothetical protein